VEALLGKASLVVEGVKNVVADSQYSIRRVRASIMEHGAGPVVPFMSNQGRGESVLRVDRFFRASGPRAHSTFL